MGMELTRDRVRNIFLSILVLLSFYLSYQLWTAGRDIGVEEVSTGQFTQTNMTLTSHTASDAFRPTYVAIHGINPQNPTMISRTYNLRSLMDHEFTNTNLDRIERTETLALMDYNNQIRTGSWLEFLYQEEMPIGILNQKIRELSRDESNEFFNRILIDVNNQDYIYLYHTESENLFVVSATEEQELNITAFLDEENLNYIEAFPYFLGKKVIYLPSQPLEVPYQSYVSDQLPTSIYINSFFPDTSLVDVRSTENVTRYIDLTKEVTINSITNTLTFIRQISDSGEMDTHTRYLRSFEQVNRFENWSDTFILSAYDKETEMTSFRREIGGFPVFGRQGYESTSTISIVESGVTNLRLPLKYISTPINIPADNDNESSKLLISGREVIERLRRLQNPELTARIQNILIGYSWIESSEDSQVVNYNPEWYIQIDKSWMTLDEFIKLQDEGVAKIGL